jgi:hypothetical protein
MSRQACGSRKTKEIKKVRRKELKAAKTEYEKVGAAFSCDLMQALVSLFNLTDWLFGRRRRRYLTPET